jgi:prolipoprotein diacylglyceryltransferase
MKTLLLNSDQIVHPFFLFIIRGGISFQTIYSIAIISGIIVMFITGYRKHYPVSTWSTIVTFIVAFLLIGIKLFAYPVKEWTEIFLTQKQDVTYIKFASAGILFVFISIPLIKLFLRFRPSVTDCFIVFLPLIEIIQRTGCLLNGCCYGKPTNLPWAIQYPPSYPVWSHHVSDGIIENSAGLSYGVHPIQVYTMVGCLLAFFIALKIKKHIKAPGNLSLVVIMLMGLSRLIIEFWRTPLAGHWFSGSLLYFNFLQWCILALILISGIVFIYRERKASFVAVQPYILREYPWRNFFVVALLFFVIWQIREIFEPTELLILSGLLLLSTTTILVQIFKQITIPSLRFASVTVIIIAFITMSQDITPSPDTLNAKKYQGWFTVGANYAGGTYKEIDRNCNGDVIGHTDHYFVSDGIDITYHFKLKEYHHLMTGLNFYHYDDQTERVQPFESGFLVFNPFVKYDFRYFGAGAGLHIVAEQEHAYTYDYSEAESYSYFPTVNSNQTLTPSFYIRGGPKDIFYGEMSVMQNYYQHGAAALWQFGIGSGLGSIDKSALRLGIAQPPNDSEILVYLSGEFLIEDRVMIRPGIAFGNGFNGSIGLQYHFGRDRWKAKK